jgi:AmmeMemoRadiSam system protein A
MDERQRKARVLVGIAREALAHPGQSIASIAWPEEWLRTVAASFVTLRDRGELRGCIGTVDAHRSLGDDVAHNAYAAAYRDTRFEPVTADVRERLDVEVSVLSPRVPVEAASEGALAEQLRPGVDGVVIQFQDRSATFLPQVWEHLPDPIDFLVELRLKARLPARFWHPELRVSRYTVEKYR